MVMSGTRRIQTQHTHAGSCGRVQPCAGSCTSRSPQVTQLSQQWSGVVAPVQHSRRRRQPTKTHPGLLPLLLLLLLLLLGPALLPLPLPLLPLPVELSPHAMLTINCTTLCGTPACCSWCRMALESAVHGAAG